ncbi:MAG TPA: TRAP transporter substrate-binding protein [Candidatus Methylomirabilis sp.]|nr:TRAP transporter substrate-binding protein [Candidatus Methylomirabilis sp.]
MWTVRKSWPVVWALFFVAVWCLPAAAQTVLKVGSQYAAKSTSILAMEKFAEYVKEKTQGKYVVRLFPDGQLGPDREMQQSLKMGTLDMLHATNNAPTLMKEGRNFEATAAPYVFRTQEEYRKFLQTPLHDEMAAALEPGGSHLVGYAGDRPPRALTTSNTPVRVPADMKGMKIRVPGMKALMAFFQEVGANPTPMPYTELFTALKTGVVVGQDNGIDNVESAGFYEVQKYYMKLDHARGVYMLYASTPKWKAWPDSLKKVLIEACQVAAEENNKLLAEYEKVAYKRLQDHGMTILDVDHPAFEEIGKRVWKKFDGDLWEKGYMDRVQATLEQIRKTK